MSYPGEQTQHKILLIGEAPGETEDLHGIPFIGKTGQYLRNFIPAEWKSKIHFQNTVRCRPTDEKGNNRAPTPRESSCCAPFLKKDILNLRPTAILGIGGEALSFFWPDAPSISKIRGIPFPFIIGDHVGWFMGTFHPSFVMRAEREDYSDGTTVNTALPIFRNDIWNFFKKIDTTFKQPPTITVPPVHIEYPKNKLEAMNLFARLKQPYAIDFETFKLKPYHRDARLLCCGCSDGELTYSFPISWPGDFNDWGMGVLVEMMMSGKEWIAQHAGMELVWIWYLTKLHKHKFHDTEVLARLLHKRHGLGSLDVLSRIYFGIDVKKLTNNKLAGQGLGPLDKERMAEYSIPQVLEYNALDAWAEVVLYHQMVKMLPPEQFGNYQRTINTIHSLTAMEVRGTCPDLNEAQKLQKDLTAKSRDLCHAATALPEVKEFERAESRIFSLSSGQVVGHVLEKYCGIKVPKSEKGNYVTSAETLEELAKEYGNADNEDEQKIQQVLAALNTPSYALLQLVLDYREVEKQKSTYIEPLLKGEIIGTDGFIHSTYTAVHTRTFRTSSADPNMQNWPKRKHREVRRVIIPRPGYVFAFFDYGQLEGRVIGMFSKDKALKQAFLTNDDIHWKWLYRIIDLYPQYMDRLRVHTGETEEKKILKGGRTIIKTDFVFATFYGSLAKSIHKRTGIPMPICDQLYHEFWTTYPHAKQWVDGQFRAYEKTGIVRSLTGRERNEILPGNEPTNGPVQGTAAEIVLEAHNYLADYGLEIDDPSFVPVLNIHDDLGFELKDDSTLGDYIENIGSEIVKPRFSFVTIPLLTECRIGYNWCDEKVIHSFTGKYYD